MEAANNLERDFISYLENIVFREDLGPLAALRRGSGKAPGTAAEMHPYVAAFATRCKTRWEEDVHYLVATLFADWYQGKNTIVRDPPRNLGASFAKLAQQVESDSIEKRFVALLNSHRDDLPVHLRHAVSLLKSKEVPIDWRQLLRHMIRWDHEDRFVQRAWAKAFWTSPPTEKV